MYRKKRSSFLLVVFYLNLLKLVFIKLSIAWTNIYGHIVPLIISNTFFKENKSFSSRKHLGEILKQIKF